MVSKITAPSNESSKITLTKEVVYGFVKELLLNKFDNPKPIPQLHLDMWDLCCKEVPYVAIAAPREHAKSTAITFSFVLACVMFRVRDYVIILSDTSQQAVDFLGEIIIEIEENEKMRELFGIKKFVKCAQKEIVVAFEDGAQFKIVAKGSEQRLRGMKWRNKRPNLVIGDDLENDEIVMNEERRSKFRSWVLNALMPVGGESCWFRFVGTILHMDSFLQRLMPKEESATTINEPLQMYDPKQYDETGWISILYRAHPDFDDFSQILWPSHHPEQRLKAKRQLYVSQGNPEGYMQEFLNYPVFQQDAYFRKQDLLPIPPKEKNPETKEYEEFYISGDLAISEKNRRAWTVFMVAGLGHTGKLRIRDVHRFRTGNAFDIIERMFELQIRYKAKLFILEDENVAKAIGSVLNQEMIKRNIIIPLLTVKPSKDKMQRARAIQYRIRAGGVEFDEEAEWYPSLYSELVNFPRSPYVDQVDCLAWIGHILDQMGEVQTGEEVKQQQEDEDLDYFYLYEADPRIMRGRDVFTNY